uniref:Adenylate kinase 9 n=1 Tax=Strigamia maritima TaxID=126957 RepID=T1JCE0_STRMM
MYQQSESYDIIKPLDYYNDDDVELEFLLSKPTAFLIIGKPFCGKTTLAKKLALGWGCPYINPDDLVKDAIDAQSDTGQVCKQFLEQGLKVEQDLIFSLVKERMERTELLNTGYVVDGFPILGNRGMHVPDQLSLMDGWNVKPNVLIHIKMSDGDEIEIFKDEHICEIESSEELLLPDFEEDEFEKMDPLVLENLISFSSQLMRQFAKDLDRYNKKFPLLQNYFANRAKIIKIELNGNLPPKSVFDGLMSTLNLMPVSRPILPMCLSESSDLNVQEDGNLNEILFSLNKLNMIAPFFRWKLSRWGQFCPVDLKNGKLALGKCSNPVVYRDKMYFLANKSNLMQFLENPRPYLIPPMPLHPCKFIIFGHLKTGKTNLAWKLSSKYRGRVIDFDKLAQTYTREIREQYLDEIWNDNLMETIAEIQTREILTAAIVAEEERSRKAHDLAQEMALKIQAERETAEKRTKKRSKSRYSKDYSESSQFTAQSVEPDSTYETTSEFSAMTTFEDLYMASLDSETILNKLQEEEIELEIPLVDEDHPEVVAIINNIMEIAESEEYVIENELYVIQLLKEIEIQRLILSHYGLHDIRDGGWVIDNFPADERLFQTAVSMGIVPACVVILKDPTEDYKIVAKRYVRTKFRKRTLITVVSHPSPTFEIHEPSASEETSSESAPDFDRLLEEELNKTDGEEQESISSHVSTVKIEEDKIEVKPQLTESEIALIKLKGTLSQMDTFFDSLTNYLPDDGTVKVIPIQITNQKSMAYTGDSDGTTPDEFHTVSRFDSSQQFHLMSDVQSQATRSELIAVHDIAATVPKIHKSPEDIASEVISILEAEFYYKCKILTELDKEQYEADVQQNVDIIVEEGEDPAVKLQEPGDSGSYCPVVLRESQVLYPGKLELELKFKDRTYWFSSEEAREAFMKRPYDYVADKKALRIPPLRICFIGPFGSQRTEQARIVASGLNIFHINFRERLQELLLGKAGRKLGFPYQTDQEQINAEDELMRNESRHESIRTSLDLDSKDSQLSVVWSDTDNSSKKSKRSTQEMDESQGMSDMSFFLKYCTEEERNFKEYLQNEVPIHETSLEQLVTPWWHQEPYCSTGFVLDGFPNNLEEAEFLLNRNLMPDALIFLIVSDVDVVQKLQTLCMKTWIERINAKKIKKEAEKRLAKQLRETALAQRRQQLEEEVNKRKSPSDKILPNDVDITDKDDDQATEINIDEILAEEFPAAEEEIEEEEETLEEAEVRCNNRLLEMLQKYEETSTTVKEMFQTAQIPCFYVDGRKTLEKLNEELRVSISPYIEMRDNLLEKTYAITLSLAEQLIQIGYKARSNFGYWCPIKVYEGSVIPNLYNTNNEPLPVLHRNHIYYLSSRSAREKFMKEPMKYICQVMPQPIVPINLAVIGTPYSGKSTLIKRFAREYNLIRLTGQQVLKYVIEKLPNTTISDFINDYLDRGDMVPHELVAAAVDEVMMHPVCQQQGVILDGIPNSLELAECLTERNIIPFCVFELKLSFKEISERVSKLESKNTENNLAISYEMLKLQYETSIHELSQLQEYYQHKHHNWTSLDAHRSQWWLWTQSSKKFLQSAKSVQNYVVATQKNEAAELSNMNLTPDEFKACLGIFRFYCPVSLAIDGELIDCSQIKDHQFCAEYNGKYYAMCCCEHLKMFLNNPDVFLPPRATRFPPKPNEAPEVLSVEKCLKLSKNQIEFGGFCPVTYVHGYKTFEYLIKGNAKFGATYNGKVYFMESEEKRRNFIKKSELFVHLKLPVKVPPESQPLDFFGLPIIGYLEQALADALLKTLTAVATKKPKYPFLDISRSAALFIAYHLKAHNPNSSTYVRKKYINKLKEFEQNCQTLQYVIKNMTLMPFKPTTRPMDFDKKLERLFELRPTPEWFNQMPKIPKPGANYQTMFYPLIVVFLVATVFGIIRTYTDKPLNDILIHLIIFVTGITSLILWKKQFLIIDQESEEYVIIWYNTILFTQPIHNIYLRIHEISKSPADPSYYQLVIQATKLPAVSITRLSTDEDRIRRIGHILSEKININFFEFEDLSHNHVIRHWPILPPDDETNISPPPKTDFFQIKSMRAFFHAGSGLAIKSFYEFEKMITGGQLSKKGSEQISVTSLVTAKSSLRDSPSEKNFSWKKKPLSFFKRIFPPASKRSMQVVPEYSTESTIDRPGTSYGSPSRFSDGTAPSLTKRNPHKSSSSSHAFNQRVFLRELHRKIQSAQAESSEESLSSLSEISIPPESSETENDSESERTAEHKV